MPTIMMCGANDLDDLDESFHEVAKQLGFTPQSSFGGLIPHGNGPNSSFIENSINAVKASHAAVIVVYEDYGELTWSVEFDELLQSGKPFRILIKSNVYESYNYWRRKGGGQSGLQVFEMFERARLEQKTFIRFTRKNFEDRLAYAISMMILEGLGSIPELARQKADGESLRLQVQGVQEEVLRTSAALHDSAQETDRMRREVQEFRTLAGTVGRENERALTALKGARDESAELRAQLVVNRRNTWAFVPLVALATLVLGLFLGGLTTEAPATSLSAHSGGSASAAPASQSSVSSSLDSLAGSAVDDPDKTRAAVGVVNRYFSYIRDQSWSSLASLQSEKFRVKNPAKNVTAFWEENLLGLWANPTVVSQNRDVLWVRVPLIIGPDMKTNRLEYRYVYWAVLRDTMLTRTVHGAAG